VATLRSDLEKPMPTKCIVLGGCRTNF